MCAVESGCDFVLGIDGRQMHIDQANFVFQMKEVEQGRYDFVTGNIFDTDFRQFGTFDIVLCLGLIYHTSKHVDLMELIDEVNDDVLVIDSVLSRAPGSFLELRREGTEGLKNAVDRGLVMRPTKQAVRDLAEEFGYSVVTLVPDFRNEKDEPDWTGCRDYRSGKRTAFLCAKRTDLSRLPVEVESP